MKDKVSKRGIRGGKARVFGRMKLYWL